MKEVLVERLGEDRVDLLCKSELGHLQLAETLSHQSILEVRVHQTFEDDHVFGVELSKALIEKTTHFWVVHFFAL